MKTIIDGNEEFETIEFNIDLLEDIIRTSVREPVSLPEKSDVQPRAASPGNPMAKEDSLPAVQGTEPGEEPLQEEDLIEKLSRKYEDKHRMSVELSTDVFTAIGRAKSKAKKEYEEALQRVETATSAVEDATGKLRIIENRYGASKSRERQVKQRLSDLPYVGETAIAAVRQQIGIDRDELAEIIRRIPKAEQAEMSAREEAMSALHMIEEPENEVREKKKLLDFAEKRRDLTDYLLTVAKKSRETGKCEAEYEAARREAAARNMDYSAAYREYSRATDFLSDVRVYAREKKRAYEDAHSETLQMRKKVDAYQELIHAEEKKAAAMQKACAAYNEVYAEYQEKKKDRVQRGRQLEAAREEYARLLDVLAYVRTEAESAADKMYRAEKLSVRDVIETNVTDKDFLYLNRYGALLAKAQADEQAALGELRHARKNRA